MSQEKATLEIIAPSIDEAVDKGLEQLGLSQEEVEVEVLDAGSRGLFGYTGSPGTCSPYHSKSS